MQPQRAMRMGPVLRRSCRVHEPGGQRSVQLGHVRARTITEFQGGQLPFPRPIMHSVLPLSSTPTSLLLSHFPAFTIAQPSGIFLAIDINNAIVCSAAARMFPEGLFTTTIPNFV